MKQGYEGIVLAWSMLAIALTRIVLAKWLFSRGGDMPKVGRFVTDPAAPPPGAVVEFVKDAGTLAKLRTTCAALMSDR
jgi:hypothetical protein